ncbi:MAG: isoprenylcysteine carboxylmethyltransferase family protein [Anaerolineae bacterium]|nr:isoprenylcysteine carboxylmethyltransferase family protein [Anaerolineae bacterium]
MTTMVHLPKQGLNRYGILRILTLMIFMALLSALLFIAAGRIDWVWGWVYVGLYVAILTINGIFLIAKNPELVNVRGQPRSDTKGWDKVFVWVAALPWLAIPVVAGLDVRYGWSVPMNLNLHFAGIIVFVLGNLLAFSAVLENRHFETTVRIQQDRGHQVITTGPYRFVRHPGYVGVILTMIGTPLILGTWWAFVPGALVMVAILYRTVREDRTLRRELAGYAEYAQRTRSRLLPGIW